MAVKKISSEEQEERRQKRIILVLFAVCIVGFSYVVYDYFNIVKRTTLPDDLTKVSGTIKEWQSKGLVDRFDVESSKLIVNENEWNKMTRNEKVGIVTQLARFCSEEKKVSTWSFQVIGNRSSAIVGELGSRGLVIP
ncbi:MAG: hypothetical protein HY966_01305 [Ignavibacteriales bacterium]|nr:hypothetical protein [Ignavibacteriales bacterium]